MCNDKDITAEDILANIQKLICELKEANTEGNIEKEEKLLLDYFLNRKIKGVTVEELLCKRAKVESSKKMEKAYMPKMSVKSVSCKDGEVTYKYWELDDEGVIKHE